jgi:hypothetical protein
MKTLDNFLTSNHVNLLKQIFFISLALVLFIFPAFGYEWVEKYKLLLWVPLVLSSGVIFLKEKVSKDSLVYFILLVLAVTVASLFRKEKPTEINMLIGLFLFVLAFSKIESIKLNPFTKYVVGLLSICSFAYQLLTYRFEVVRPTLSIIDPNYAGLLMLLFFFFSWKSRFWPGVLFAVFTSFLLLSRNFFLSLIVFFLAEFFIRKLPTINKKLDPLALAFLSLFFVWFIGYLYLTFMSASSNSPSGIGRLFHYQDESNFKRFQINKIFIEGLFQNKIYAIFGMGSQYMSNILKQFEIVLHNSFLEFWAKSGLMVFGLFFLFLKRGFQKLWSTANFSIWLSYFFFATFLHSAFEAKYLIFFLVVLLIDTSDFKVNIKNQIKEV